MDNEHELMQLTKEIIRNGSATTWPLAYEMALHTQEEIAALAQQILEDRRTDEAVDWQGAVELAAEIMPEAQRIAQDWETGKLFYQSCSQPVIVATKRALVC